MERISRLKGESFLDFANRIVTDENIKEYGTLSIYNSLFDTDASYDNAQRQLAGVRKFLLQYRTDSIDTELEKSPERDYSQELDISINKDGSQTRNALLELSEEEIKTPELLLRAHGYDPKQWVLVNSKNSMWHQNSNEHGLKTLYCSKVTVQPRAEISLEEVQEIFDRLDRKHTTSIEYKEAVKAKSTDECFVLNLFDVHFSKLAHISESGEDYDYKIAKKRMIESVEGYINRFIGSRRFKAIYFAIGQDYFNAEPTGNTVGNTRQDNDSRYSVMFEKGTEALIEVIDMLKTISDAVYVPLVQGNHSTYTEYYAAQFLRAWYKDDERVFVDASPAPRKYYRYGANLFGFTHNSEEKNRLQTLMQIEVPSDWAITNERTWFTGHLHCENVKEEGGIFVRQAPTICGTDAWHSKKGYVGSIKRSQGFIYDKEKGLVESHYVKVA